MLPLAHVSGVPVEELVALGLAYGGLWCWPLSARLRALTTRWPRPGEHGGRSEAG